LTRNQINGNVVERQGYAIKSDPTQIDWSFSREAVHDSVHSLRHPGIEMNSETTEAYG